MVIMMMIGTIPSELGMLSKVEYFELSRNSLEGAHTSYHSLPCGVCGVSEESMKKNESCEYLTCTMCTHVAVYHDVS